MLQLRYAIAGFSLVACLCTIGELRAQTVTKVPDAPLPAALHTAKNVFISFAGGDASFNRDSRQIYNQFYAEIKERGRYNLVGSPGAADLVLQVSFASPISNVVVGPAAGGGSWGNSSIERQLRLVLLDPKTGIALWGFTERVVPALLAESREKNLKIAVRQLAADLNALIGSSP